jgi:hypothetical protein
MAALFLLKLLLVILFIIAFFKKLIELYFPKPQPLKSPQIKDLIIKSANHFGFNVVSTLLDDIDDWYYLGIPINRTNQSAFESLINPIVKYSTLAHPTASDRFNGMTYDITTFGGFLRWLMIVTNARMDIIGNTIYLERRDVVVNITSGITTGLTNQSLAVTDTTPNTDESWARFLLLYPKDGQDVYTTDMFNESVTEWATINNDTSNPDLDVLTKLRKIDMQLCLGRRKTYGMFLNKFLNSILSEKMQDTINFFTGNAQGTPIDWTEITPVLQFVNAVNPDASQLVTSDYTYERPKLLCLNPNGTLKSDWIDKISARSIFTRFHEIDFIGNNSWMLHKGELAEANSDDFQNMDNNGFIELDGQECKLLDAKYNEFARRAEITYKRPSDYANTVSLIEIA